MHEPMNCGILMKGMLLSIIKEQMADAHSNIEKLQKILKKPDTKYEILLWTSRIENSNL